MPGEPPSLDSRTFDEIRAEVVRLARSHAPEWRGRTGDVGATLLAIYAHYLEFVIQRLNRVPEKSFLAFLDLLGIGLLPPGAARTPLVFSLAPTAGEAGVVPRGTQVATSQSETQPAVVFETVQDLNVVAARLVASSTVDPRTDRYGDRSAVVALQDPTVFPPFEGDQPIDHLLYLGSDPLLLVQRQGTLELTVTVGAPQTGWPAIFDPVEWEAFRSGTWERLPAPTIDAVDAVTARLTFLSFAGADRTEVAGSGLSTPIASRWIRGRLRFPRTEHAQITGSGAVMAIRPSVRVPHAAGAPLTLLRQSTATTLAAAAPTGSGTITLQSGTALGRGDVVMLDQGEQTEFVALGPVPAVPGPVSVPVTPATRFSHAAGATVTKVTTQAHPVETTLAAGALPGATTLSPASTAGLAEGDVVRIGNPVGLDPLTRDVELDAVGAYVTAGLLLPDRVHVNGSPVDPGSAFLPLGPDPRIGDTFALGSAEAFSKVERGARLPSGGQVEVAVQSDPGVIELTWEYFGGPGELSWKELKVGDKTGGFTRDGRIEATPLPLIHAVPWPVEQQLGFFRVRLADGASYRRAPRLQRFELQAKPPLPAVAFSSEIPIDVFDKAGHVASLDGLTPIDPRLPFFPFGPNPRPGNTFTFGFPAAVLRSLGSLLLEVLLAQTARLLWEYSTGTGWRRLGESSTRDSWIGERSFEFNDTTRAFVRTGRVSFRRPADFAPIELDGQAGFWVRARLVSGQYGAAAELVPAVPGDPMKGFQFRQGTGALNPPAVDSLTLSYEADTSAPVVLTRNGFAFVDRTLDNAPGGGAYRPFEPVDEPSPTFYLGLDRTLPNESVSLYFATPPREYVERLPAPAAGAPPAQGSEEIALAWEYWNGVEWARLAVLDGTRALTESGIVQFVGPSDMDALRLFDEPAPRFWVRARLVETADGDAQVLSGVFLNAVESEQATAIRGEVLGSSSGEAGQVFRVARPPVLPGQVVEVVEPELPSDEEQAAIRAEEGRDAVRVVPTPDGGQQVRVRWHEVGTLARSGPRSRHYMLDRILGEVQAGNGVHGLIPPTGRDNVVASLYRSGGDPRGNQPAGAVSQLKTSIPYVASVTNPIQAGGGAAAETTRGVMARGPQVLRHRHRAVTPDDFEWLAREVAGTRVARARALPNRDRDLDFDPGWVTVIVVPDGTERKLLPSTQLVRELEDGLGELALATLTAPTPAHVNVVGPGYVPVELAAEIVPVDPTSADAARKSALAALDRFFHPLVGGPDGDGWELGRDVHLSEVFAVLEALPAVEHVRSLTFRPTVAAVPLVFAGPPGLTAPADEPAGTVVTTQDGLLAAILVEPIEQGAVLAEAMVVVFREGERIQVGTDLDARTVTVRGVSGSTLSVDPFRARADQPAGTVVASLESQASSVLTAPIAAGVLVTQLSVRGLVPGDSLVLPAPPGAPAVPLATAGSGRRQRLILGERLRVPELHLVASGSHTVTISLE
jgi:predicted phage baseplate assembly protein